MHWFVPVIPTLIPTNQMFSISDLTGLSCTVLEHRYCKIRRWIYRPGLGLSIVSRVPKHRKQVKGCIPVNNLKVGGKFIKWRFLTSCHSANFMLSRSNVDTEATRLIELGNSLVILRLSAKVITLKETSAYEEPRS